MFPQSEDTSGTLLDTQLPLHRITTNWLKDFSGHIPSPVLHRPLETARLLGPYPSFIRGQLPDCQQAGSWRGYWP